MQYTNKHFFSFLATCFLFFCNNAISLPINYNILNIKPINTIDKTYSGILYKTNDNKIFLTDYSNKTGKEISSVELVSNGINKGLIFPLSLDLNAISNNILVFLFNSNEIVKIYKIKLSSDGKLLSPENILTNTVDGNLISMPLLMNLANNKYLILAFKNKIKISKFDSLSTSLNFIHGLEINNSNIIKIMPLNGLILAVTSNKKAILYSLPDLKPINVYSLSSVSDVYIYYDAETKKSYIHTSANNIDITKNPSPYGIVGLYSKKINI